MTGCIFLLLVGIVPVLISSSVRFEIRCSPKGIEGVFRGKLGLFSLRASFRVYHGRSGWRLYVNSPAYETETALWRIRRRKKKKKRSLRILRWIRIQYIRAEIGLENAAVLALVCGGAAGILEAIVRAMESDTTVQVAPVFETRGFLLNLSGMIQANPLQIIGRILCKRRKQQCPIP